MEVIYIKNKNCKFPKEAEAIAKYMADFGKNEPRIIETDIPEILNNSPKTRENRN